MNNGAFAASLRLSAVLLLVGQLVYIVLTQFHPGIGETPTNRAAVFTEYAADASWIAVHLGQFAGIAILLAGLFALFFALNAQSGAARWTARFGAASAVAALALYGGVQAVDGVANKHADVAWVAASEAEKAARFASAEAIRWLEWGMRSYHDYALGLAFLLIGIAVVLTPRLPRPIGYLMGLTGVAYLAQGWVLGYEGFSQTQSLAIVLGWVLSALWMLWLVLVAWRLPGSEAPSGQDELVSRAVAT